MESRAIKIFAPNSKKIFLKVIPGHFATAHSHINQYIDLTSSKTRLSEASETARVMAMKYVNTVMIDTIVCMEGCEVVGAFLAQELTDAGIMSMNAHQTIYIVSPEFSTNGQMIFTENMKPTIFGKQVLLLVASATTGDTIRRGMEGIRYYGGVISGISAIFSAVDSIDDMPVHSIYQAKDLPDYKSYNINECPLCKAKQRLEAIVNGHGYMKL
ncbi:MAG TPA: orotate phosphoribosyltransferase [Mobilitalea sp.]|nr:orotate phosphoribosyltransferase [Mobilitalea sp.]